MPRTRICIPDLASSRTSLQSINDSRPTLSLQIDCLPALSQREHGQLHGAALGIHRRMLVLCLHPCLNQGTNMTSQKVLKVVLNVDLSQSIEYAPLGRPWHSPILQC